MKFKKARNKYRAPSVKSSPRRRIQLSGFNSFIEEACVIAKPLGKVSLLIFVVVMLGGFWVSASISNIEHSMDELGSKLLVLETQNVYQRIERAKFNNPDQIKTVAGDELSLYLSKREQVGIYVRGGFRKGHFDRDSRSFIYGKNI